MPPIWKTLRPYFSIFLGWANEAAARALGDERFNHPSNNTTIGWRNEGVFPGNHGATLAAACFARTLRDNSELDSALLLQACDEIAESALDGGSKMWDYIAQSQYLRCIRLSLVAGDANKAQYFLNNIRRKFKHTFVHHEWLQILVNDVLAADGKALSQESAERFEVYFDQVRDPAYVLQANKPNGINLSANLSILRLELAVIKQRYLAVQPLAGNWQDVLGLISQ